MKRDIVVCACDITGKFAQPWVAAGYRAILIDPQHGTTDQDFVNGVMRVAEPIQTGVMPAVILRYWDQICFLMAFPMCTHLSASGARWWADKELKNPGQQQRAADFAQWLGEIGEKLGVPWMVENPKGALTRLWRKWDHMFQPWEFSFYCLADSYMKGTCIWMGGGAVMPEPCVAAQVQHAIDNVVEVFGKMVPPLKVRQHFPKDSPVVRWYPDDRIHFASPGEDRANQRSGTPLGWSTAVFMANGLKEAA